MSHDLVGHRDDEVNKLNLLYILQVFEYGSYADVTHQCTVREKWLITWLMITVKLWILTPEQDSHPAAPRPSNITQAKLTQMILYDNYPVLDDEDLTDIINSAQPALFEYVRSCNDMIL